jgi:hypothetical protein
MNTTSRPPGRARLALALLLVAGLASAQNYRLPWNSINSGGKPGTSTSYQLNGTLAQPVQGTGASASYRGWWGFWYGAGGPMPSADVQLLSIDMPAGDSVNPGALTPQATAKELALTVIASDTVEVSYRILDSTGTEVYSRTVTVYLALNGSASPTFPSWTAPAGTSNWTAIARAVSKYDNNHSNDSLVRVFHVRAVSSQLGWYQRADMPPGGRGKRVKDGGCLAYSDDDTAFVYALKGNGRCEYYRFNITGNTWTTKESIPAFGSSGKKKAVKKGAAMTQAEGLMYATKGNGTVEWWQYDPALSGSPTYPWQQKTDIPMGAKACKEGCGAAAVQVGDTTYAYFLKGSSTTEFYRYNTLSGVWQTMAGAPSGLSGKGFKDGSCLAATADGRRVYALKGTYNEFFDYSVDSNRWSTKAPMPLTGSSGKKKKVKSGAGIASYQSLVYGLKGNGTQEFWKYNADSDKWQQAEDMPLGGGKKVKGGGALVYAAQPLPTLFALKGNNTLEFWAYGLGALAAGSRPQTAGRDVQSGEPAAAGGIRLAATPTILRTPQSAIRIDYSLPTAGSYSLRLYSVSGRLVATLASGHGTAGSFSLSVPRSALSSGIYVLKLATDGTTLTAKLVIE